MECVAVPLLEKARKRRVELKKSSNCIFLSRSEFSRIAISNRRLVRCDDPVARVHGFHDIVTGDNYLIEEEELFNEPV